MVSRTASPTTTLTVHPTADGKRFRATCPWHHQVPVIFRDDDAWVAGHAMALHIETEHQWRVLSIHSEQGEKISRGEK